MLRYSFKLDTEAKAIEHAVADTLSANIRTRDIAGESKGVKIVSTSEMGNEIISRILITNLFYNENGFYLADNTFGLIIYEGAYYLTIAVILLLLVMLLLNLFKNIKPFGMPRKAVIFFIVVVIMAPGIVVNSILKENVGRPRPIHITEYGGTAVFQPPFVISNQCENNCSFVSSAHQDLYLVH